LIPLIPPFLFNFTVPLSYSVQYTYFAIQETFIRTIERQKVTFA
jgi:hypothetical protein